VETALTLKLMDLTETNNGKFKCVLSDEKENIQGVITSQVSSRHDASTAAPRLPDYYRPYSLIIPRRSTI
jgi:hypothetical protein